MSHFDVGGEVELASQLSALGGSGASLESVLERLLDAMEPAEGEEASPELVREIVALQLRTPLDAEERPAEQLVYDALAGLFSELAGRGELRTDVAIEPLTAMVLTSIFGTFVARGASPSAPRHPTREQLVAVLLPGLRAS